MSRPIRRNNYQRLDFSDEEIYEEIKDEIRSIKERELKNVEEAELIYNLYNSHKQEKRKRKMKEKSSEARSHLLNSLGGMARDSSDDEEG